MCGKNNVILLSSTKSNKMGSRSNKNVYRYTTTIGNFDLIKNCVAFGLGRTEKLDLKLINLTLIQIMPDNK